MIGRFWKFFINLAQILAFSALAATGPAIAWADADSSQIQAQYGKTISDVEVRGNQRIEREAIVTKLSLKAGSIMTREALREDVKAVFGMGYFDEVEIAADPEANGKVKLIVGVRERPVIAEVAFEGNERVSSSDLRDIIKVKQWSILDVNKVREDVAIIQKNYEDKGFFLAKVAFEVRPVEKEKDQVKLVYRINDFDKVQIKKITFLNNTRFSDSELQAAMPETREGGFWSFMSNSGNFKESSFKNDLQRLTYFYLDRGYMKFRYDSPVVTVSDDKKYVFITIYVEEGEQYSMGKLDFSGDLLFAKKELHSDLTLTHGDTFSISKRNADIQKLTERYQDLGYAFVNVIPKMNINDEARIVDIDYAFEKGNLAYFGEINMANNSKTHDKVIRRELKIKEGELYSGTKMRESRENVERLGFFAPGEVIFNTVTAKGRSDVLNVEISVKERSTGTITLGAGYGSVQKFFFTTQVSEINLFGRGQNLSLTAQLAADRRSKSFNLGFTDPYSFDTRWSLGFDVFFSTFPIPDKYTTRKLGFNLRGGHPISEYTTGFITYKHEGMKIEDLADPGIDPRDIAADEGVLSSLVWSVVRDRRNNRFETTQGSYQAVFLETAGLGGDKVFAKWGAENRFYTKIAGDLVFRTKAEYGHISQFFADKPIPPSERFYLGGPNNLRGYRLFSVGPSRVRETTFPGLGNFTIREPLGGIVQLLGIAELEYPLIREAGIKFVTFFDVGNAYSAFPTEENFTLRTNTGLGLRWFSPIGPLRFEWGFPLQRKPGEDSSMFQFFIGPPF